jgi:integrase
MPIYTESIRKIIYVEDVDKMWQSAKYESERVVLSILWISGARPAEVLNLKRKNVNWGIDENGRDFFEIKLETKKLAKAVGFVVDERILTTSRPLGNDANIYVETLIRWCMKLDPEDYVMVNRSRMSLNRLMHRLSKCIGHVWSAYHFRHSVFTHMARNHASLSDLMHWKGAAHPSSVMRYIQATPAYIQIETQNRSKNLYQKERYSAKVIQKVVTADEAKEIPIRENEDEKVIENE